MQRVGMRQLRRECLVAQEIPSQPDGIAPEGKVVILDNEPDVARFSGTLARLDAAENR
jgi:hypothetical protein